MEDGRRHGLWAGGRAISERRSLWLAAVVCVTLSLPYLLMVRTFFFTDDWVHLEFNRATPPWQVWRYFSPQVIWFYRPLQSLQFGWLYHAFGLEPLVYNLVLWGMHVGVCLLVYVLAVQILSRRAALLTAALFASHWVYATVLVWRSNFSTLQWAIVTLALCIVFLRYLMDRRPAYLAGVYALSLLNFTTKESAASTPLLLIALWLWYTWTHEVETPLRSRLMKGARVIAPLAALTAGYVALHYLVVHDIYQGYVVPRYGFVDGAKALKQTLFAHSYVLLAYFRDPPSLPALPRLKEAVQFLVQNGAIVPLALMAAAWRWREPAVALGTCWALAALLPIVWMPSFHSDRFYYVPAIGSSLVLARGLQLLWRKLSGPARPLRCLVLAAMGYMLVANVSLALNTCVPSCGEAGRAETAFRTLQAYAGQLPRGPLIIVKNLGPSTAFGVTEMARMALDDPEATGLLAEQAVSAAQRRCLDRIPGAYVLDCEEMAPALRPLNRRSRPTKQAGGVVTYPTLRTAPSGDPR
jgi:hypothetical protein